MAKDDRDARSWRANKHMLEILHQSLIEDEDASDLTDFQRDMVEGMGAIAKGDFEEAYRKLDRMVRDTIDPYVLAIATVDEERGEYCRIYSSRPDEFPVTDGMLVPDGPWSTAILENRQLMASNYLTAVAKHVPDGAEGLAMGCMGFCYMPISDFKEDGELLGILVLFDKSGGFDEEDLKTLGKMHFYFSIYLNNIIMAKKFDGPESHEPEVV